MQSSDRTRLERLGSGESIAAICRDDGIDRAQFDLWWKQTIEQRTPGNDAVSVRGVGAEVEIVRDSWGIPHIFAESSDDLFFGFFKFLSAFL